MKNYKKLEELKNEYHRRREILEREKFAESPVAEKSLQGQPPANFSKVDKVNIQE